MMEPTLKTSAILQSLLSTVDSFTSRQVCKIWKESDLYNQKKQRQDTALRIINLLSQAKNRSGFFYHRQSDLDDLHIELEKIHICSNLKSTHQTFHRVLMKTIHLWKDIAPPDLKSIQKQNEGELMFSQVVSCIEFVQSLTPNSFPHDLSVNLSDEGDQHLAPPTNPLSFYLLDEVVQNENLSLTTPASSFEKYLDHHYSTQAIQFIKLIINRKNYPDFIPLQPMFLSLIAQLFEDANWKQALLATKVFFNDENVYQLSPYNQKEECLKEITTISLERTKPCHSPETKKAIDLLKFLILTCDASISEIVVKQIFTTSRSSKESIVINDTISRQLISTYYIAVVNSNCPIDKNLDPITVKSRLLQARPSISKWSTEVFSLLSVGLNEESLRPINNWKKVNPPSYPIEDPILSSLYTLKSLINVIPELYKFMGVQ